MSPISLAFAIVWSGFIIFTSYPGTALQAEPYFVFIISIPVQLELIAQLVSVCHQWSITGTLSKFSAHLIVSGSARSPAKNNDSKELKSYFEKNFPSGSSFLIALKAVGAVNKDLIL